MRKSIYSLLLLISTTLLAQKEVPEYGKIDMADLQMKSCAFEPSAPAMKLFDVQEINFEDDYYTTRLKTERRVRIKIFNENGYKYAAIKIPYFSKKRVTKIKDLGGVVYSLDASGKIVTQKLEKKDFFKEKSEDNLGIINFTFPHLQPGSVIEFHYTKIEKNILQIDPWVVQDKIPVAYSAATITTPSYVKVKEKVYGTDSISQTMEILKGGAYNRVRKTYYRENIHPFEPEPFMSSYKDNLLRVVFVMMPTSNFFFDLSSPLSTWKFIGSRLLESPYFGGQIEKNIPGTEKLIDSAKSFSFLSEKIHFLYEAVKKRIPEKAEQTLYPGDIEEAWKNKSGNTAEINLIFLNLLQKASVEAYPVLVSTRENGKVKKDFPSAGQLNGVDVLVMDSTKNYLMDASLKFQSYQNPPLNVLNREGFLMQRGNMQWVSIDDDRQLLRQITNVLCKVKQDGTIDGEAYCEYYDYAKSYMLDSTLDEDDEADNKFIDKKPVGLQIISTTNKNDDNDTLPLAQNIKFTYEPPSTNEFYFINPQILSGKKQNPFTKDSRSTDIDFGCNQRMSLTMQISLPAGFEVNDLPKNMTVRAPDSSFFFQRRCFKDTNSILLTQVFEIQRPIFEKEEYEGVKEFFKRIYALMNEEIVLKRSKKIP